VKVSGLNGVVNLGIGASIRLILVVRALLFFRRRSPVEMAQREKRSQSPAWASRNDWTESPLIEQSVFALIESDGRFFICGHAC
jgi:hypothetical protein